MEMKQFYEFIEGVDGHEEALAFIKEHNGKIADLEAKVRLSGKDTEELTEKIKHLSEENKSLKELADAGKEGKSVELKELEQKFNALQEQFTAKEQEAIKLAEEKQFIENRGVIVEQFKKGGIDTGKDAFSDFLNSRFGKEISVQEGKIVANTKDGEKIGDAAIEYYKGIRSDLVTVKEGTSSRPVSGDVKTDRYAGLSSHQKLVVGMK